MLRVEFCKTGPVSTLRRAEFYADGTHAVTVYRDPPFKFTQVSVESYHYNQDHIVVVLDTPVCLTTGYGSPVPARIYKLNFDHENSMSYYVENMLCNTFRGWYMNAPIWRINSIERAKEAAYTWILVAQHVTSLNKDLQRHIAARILDTRYDNEWIHLIAPRSVKRLKR